MFCTRPKLHWDFFQAREDAESTADSSNNLRKREREREREMYSRRQKSAGFLATTIPRSRWPDNKLLTNRRVLGNCRVVYSSGE